MRAPVRSATAGTPISGRWGRVPGGAVGRTDRDDDIFGVVVQALSCGKELGVDVQ